MIPFTEIQEKREALKGLYPSSMSWYDKVDKMSDKQVVAIYLRYKEQGKLSS